MRWKNCEACDSTGESEKWIPSSGVYHDHPCTVCHGTGKVKDEQVTESMEETNMQELVWKCDSCKHVEPVEDGGYELGDVETCVHCDDGVAEVMEKDLVPHVVGAGMPQHENTEFDKFMDSTLLKEGKKLTQDASTVSPQRRLARNYQEHPLGRVKMGAKR